MRVDVDDLGAISEVATALGLTTQRVDQITRTHADAPQVVARIAKRRVGVYRMSAWRRWAAKHGRTWDDTAWRASVEVLDPADVEPLD